ncbi:Clp protease N-terminal domain-containing protein, partial [Acinetobacter baumannii]
MGINLKSLISKLNESARLATERAATLCMSRGQYEVDLEHLFLALLEQPQSDFCLIARRSGISL